MEHLVKIGQILVQITSSLENFFENSSCKFPSFPLPGLIQLVIVYLWF